MSISGGKQPEIRRFLRQQVDNLLTIPRTAGMYSRSSRVNLQKGLSLSFDWLAIADFFGVTLG